MAVTLVPQETEVWYGSSICIDLTVKVDKVTVNPDALVIITTSPAGVVTTYTYDGVNEQIRQDSGDTGNYSFSSDETDEAGRWEVAVDITFNVSGGNPKTVREIMFVTVRSTRAA